MIYELFTIRVGRPDTKVSTFLPGTKEGDGRSSVDFKEILSFLESNVSIVS